MKLIIFSIIVFFAINVGAQSEGFDECVAGLNAQELEYMQGVVLVGFESGVNESEALEIIFSVNETFKGNLTSGNSSNGLNFEVLVSEGKEIESVCLFLENENVEYSELNVLFDNAVCTQDVKICPDGSSVGRVPELNCSFAECPEEDYRYCAERGELCGGIAGISCCDGLRCELEEGNYSDASGNCVEIEESSGKGWLYSIFLFLAAVVLIVLGMKILKWIMWILALLAIAVAFYIIFVW